MDSKHKTTLRKEVVCELGGPSTELLVLRSDFESYSTKNVCMHKLIFAFMYMLQMTKVGMFV